VILEGGHLPRVAAADRLAYRIWVQAPQGLRMHRGMERDGRTHRKLWLDWMKQEGQFFADDATRSFRMTCGSAGTRASPTIGRAKS
jgi:hypothetical protein